VTFSLDRVCIRKEDYNALTGVVCGDVYHSEARCRRYISYE